MLLAWANEVIPPCRTKIVSARGSKRIKTQAMRQSNGKLQNFSNNFFTRMHRLMGILACEIPMEIFTGSTILSCAELASSICAKKPSQVLADQLAEMCLPVPMAQAFQAKPHLCHLAEQSFVKNEKCPQAIFGVCLCTRHERKERHSFFVVSPPFFKNVCFCISAKMCNFDILHISERIHC